MGFGETILIIGDEENLRTTLGAILRRAGYTVTIMGQVDEALKSLQDTCYDLVFLDLKMSELNGVNPLPEIRRRRPGTPVILLTAGAPYDPDEHTGRTTPFGYLLKPIDPERIVACTDDMLRKSQQVKGAIIAPKGARAVSQKKKS